MTLEGKKVVVYGQGDCIWCFRVCELLDEQNTAYEFIVLDHDNEAKAMLVGLGLTTVPQVFVDGLLVGGFEDTKAYLEGVGTA